MNVLAGYSFTSGDEWKKVSVSLNHYDLIQLVRDGRVEGYQVKAVDPEIRIVDDSGVDMPLDLQFQVLQAQADCYLIVQRAQLGYPADKAKADIAAIRKRVPILK